MQKYEGQPDLSGFASDIGYLGTQLPSLLDAIRTDSAKTLGDINVPEAAAIVETYDIELLSQVLNTVADLYPKCFRGV